MKTKSVFFTLSLIVLLTHSIVYSFEKNSPSSSGSNYEKSLKVFTRLINKDNSDFRAYNGRGVTWFYLGKYRRAISDYTRAIEENPSYSEAYCNRGIIWLYKNNLDQAIVDFNTAIKIKPDYYEAFCYRGDAWYKKRESDLALSDYDTALKIHPEYANAYNNRGFVLSKNGIYGLAIYDYKKALKIDDKFYDANLNLAWLLASCADERYRNGTGAVLYAKKATELQLTPYSLDTLAAAYAEANEFSKAVSTQKKAIHLLKKTNSYRSMQRFNEKLALYKAQTPIPTDAIIKQAPLIASAVKNIPSVDKTEFFNINEILPRKSHLNTEISRVNEKKSPFREETVEPEPHTIKTIIDKPKTIRPADKILPEQINNIAGILNSKSFRESRKTAIGAALKLWGYNPDISEKQNKPSDTFAFFQSIAKTNDLKVLKLKNNFNMIKKLNIPVILRFRPPGMSSPRYYTITGMTDDSVFLYTGDNSKTVEMPIRDVKKFWTGEIFVPWKNHLGIKGTIPRDAPQYSVIILKSILLQMGFTDIDAGQKYDASTKAKIMKFQKTKNIDTDGVVGPITKIMLYNELQFLTIPHISKNALQWKTD